jgi:hypothetical protein
MGTAARPAGAFRIPLPDPAITLVVAALVSIGVLTWSGLRSGRAASARKAELTRVRGDLAGFEDLRRRYAPAVAAPGPHRGRIAGRRGGRAAGCPGPHRSA